MTTQPELIYAQVSQNFMTKADRIFRNDDSGVFVEVIQNARRAGATRIDVTIEAIPGPKPVCRIVVQDNGTGIANFHDLHLGESGWDETTRTKEDAAGAGFYSLCHSEVTVHSGAKVAKLTPASFLGKAPMEMYDQQPWVAGTRIEFTRPSELRILTSALESVTEFCPVEVYVNGNELPRHDFLAGSLHRKLIDGVEVGFAIRFEHRNYVNAPNWNFYGLCLRQADRPIEGLLIEDSHGCHVWSVETRFNVLMTDGIQPQLPERRAILEGEALTNFLRKARAAAYRFFQSVGRHVLSFRHWKEAKELGVTLPEALPLLKTWHAQPADDHTEPLFGKPVSRVEPNTLACMLVDSIVPNRHTFEAALQQSPFLRDRLCQENEAYRGYSWYDAMLRIEDTVILVDSSPLQGMGIIPQWLSGEYGN